MNMRLRRICGLLLAFCVLWPEVSAQSRRATSLHQSLTKSGTLTLGAFESVAEPVRRSIVRFEINGEPVALGAVVSADGGVLTKASEVAGERLVAVLTGGRRVAARVLAVDEESDVALVRVDATGLVPIVWFAGSAVVGQWAVTPGIDSRPEAIGVISTPPRRILHARALIGVRLDLGSQQARVAEVVEDLGADQAGILAGDVILAVDGELVDDGEDLMRALREFRAGQTVALRVLRAERTFEVELPMMPPSVATRTAARRGRLERMSGDISARADGFSAALQHDSVLHPWQCGGPLLNVEGQAMGLNIARAGRVASYALPAELVQEILGRLLADAE